MSWVVILTKSVISDNSVTTERTARQELSWLWFACLSDSLPTGFSFEEICVQSSLFSSGSFCSSCLLKTSWPFLSIPHSSCPVLSWKSSILFFISFSPPSLHQRISAGYLLMQSELVCLFDASCGIKSCPNQQHQQQPPSSLFLPVKERGWFKKRSWLPRKRSQCLYLQQ